VDVKNYAKIEKIPGGTIEDCKVSRQQRSLHSSAVRALRLRSSSPSCGSVIPAACCFAAWHAASLAAAGSAWICNEDCGLACCATITRVYCCCRCCVA
jgi:hypothetical protein